MYSRPEKQIAAIAMKKTKSVAIALKALYGTSTSESQRESEDLNIQYHDVVLHCKECETTLMNISAWLESVSS